MKKRWFAILMSAALALGLLTGCGNSRMSTETAVDASAYSENSNSYAQTLDEASGDAATPSETMLPTSKEKLIYTGQLDLQTTDLTAAMRQLEQLVADCGGYLESSERYSDWANYTVRVPQTSFASFMSAAGEQADCRVTYQSTSIENVGEIYADLENRLDTLRIKLDRLQSLLAQAENMEDIITIENSISDTESEIEQLSGQKKHYDSLIDFSTVTVSITESTVLGEGENATLGQRLSAGFLSGLSGFGEDCTNALVWIVSHLLTIVIVVVIAIIAIVFIRRKRRQRNVKKAENTQQQ